jgi:hypothetical protein
MVIGRGDHRAEEKHRAWDMHRIWIWQRTREMHRAWESIEHRKYNIGHGKGTEYRKVRDMGKA